MNAEDIISDGLLVYKNDAYKLYRFNGLLWAVFSRVNKYDSLFAYCWGKIGSYNP